MSTENENWLDDILGQPQDTGKIVADDAAADAVGLSHPDDLELEKIVQETIAANWGDEAALEEATAPSAADAADPEADATQFFTPPQSPTTEQAGEQTAAEPVVIPETDNASLTPAEDTDASQPAQQAASGVSQDTFIGEPLVPEDAFGDFGEEAPSEEKTIPTDTEETEPAPMEQKKPARKFEKRNRPGNPVGDESKRGRIFRYLKDIFNIPHILATAIWVVLILFIGTTLGRTVWLCAEDLLALGKTPQEVTITISANDDLGDIAQKLEDSGMIRYAKLFEIFARITGKGNEINTGEITFSGNTIYDYNALVYTMSYDSSSLNTVSVTIPEGYNCKQIFELLEKNGVCSVSELEKHAANGELGDYWFLEGIKRGGRYCLEGFLFPDTYEFYIGDTAEHAIEKLLDGFEYRFSERLKEKFEKLNTNLGLNLSLREVITMASIVQKEKANDPEGYTIASVFYNRLQNSASFPFLNSDATSNYATDVLGATTDSQINASPYNTYTQKGLPPGPICNPGLSSIDAALEPEDTKYFFFVLDKSINSHVFSKTYEEHQRKLRELGLA